MNDSHKGCCPSSACEIFKCLPAGDRGNRTTCYYDGIKDKKRGDKEMSFNRLINRTDVESSLLVRDFYPDFSYSRKVKIVKKAAGAHKNENSAIKISRYEYAGSSPLFRTGKTEIVRSDHYFDYTEDAGSEEAKVWYANFADPYLFVAYASELFAQDEIQTLEMPLLAAVKVYLQKSRIPGLEPKTESNKKPTPFLLEGVPYWNRIDTNPVLSNGEHESIYGNSFASASEEAIERGVTVYNGGLNCNIMAIAAPYGYSDSRYSRAELEYILKTLLCAFSAAADASEKKTVIHSGNWGCGAFGGNKELMYVAQLICADICGVDRLVMHRVDEDDFNTALKVYNSILGSTTFDSLVNFLDCRNYTWGESNGT